MSCTVSVLSGVRRRLMVWVFLARTGVRLQTVYKCLESPDEMETTEMENSYQLSCFIAQGRSVDIVGNPD